MIKRNPKGQLTKLKLRLTFARIISRKDKMRWKALLKHIALTKGEVKELDEVIQSRRDGIKDS